MLIRQQNFLSSLPHKRVIAIVSAGILALAACGADSNAAPKRGNTKGSEKADMSNAPLSADAPGWLVTAYDENRERLLWTGNRKNVRRLNAYLEQLDEARRYGLDPDDYRLTWIADRLEGAGRRKDPVLEEIASRSFVNFARDVRDGRVDPRIVFDDETLHDRDVTNAELFAEFARNPDPDRYLTGLRRDNPIDRALAPALARYEAYAREGGFPAVEIGADKLELGDAGPGVETVAARLRAEGFFTGEVAKQDVADTEESADATAAPVREALFDQRLADAVTAFQVSRGIEPDGVVGGETLSRMNESAQSLVESIRLNMERARWLPQDFAERYILVNIARFTVGMYANEKMQDEMRVVVGKLHQQTPVFAGSMSYLVINPYWNVPASILRDEIAPKVADDRGYLEAQNMEVVRGWGDNEEVISARKVDWDDIADEEGVRVRQKPGPQNALGLVKFMFPNDYNVYLHDTPADRLFDHTERAFSHGCIRLERPLDMARWVLRGEPGLDRPIEEVIRDGERTVVTLETEIPVYITYFTVWADENGGVSFLPDVYGRDDRLAAALDDARMAGAAPSSTALR